MFSYSSSSYIRKQLLSFILLGVRAVSLGRPDLCKVLCPFVAALQTAFQACDFPVGTGFLS